MMSKNNKEKANIYTYPFATPAAMMLVMKEGGQQELLDQVAMQPDKNYNERVNAYINKVKQVAMDKVQEEMLDTSMSYGEEADNIMSMIPMAQMGMQFSPQAYKTVDAFTKAAKPKNDMGKLFTEALAPAMFSNAWDQNADPLDKYYVKNVKVKDVTAKDLEKYYEKPKAQNGIAVQGTANDEVIDNGDGTISVFSSDGTTRRYASKEQFKKLYKPAAGKTAQVTKELPTTVNDASFTVDPNIAQAAMEAESSKYTFDKSANTPAKKDQTQVTTGSDNPIVDSLKTMLGNYGTTPVTDQQTVQQQTQASVGDGLDWFRALVPGGGQRGAIMRGDEPEAFFSPNTVVAGVRGDYRFNPGNIFRSSENKRPGALKSASIMFGEYDPSGIMVPYGQAPQEYIPIVPNQTPGQQRREERQADRAQRREDKAENIYNRFAEKAASIKDAAGINNDGTRNRVMREPVYAEFKKGGALDKFLRKAQMGEENPAPGTTKQASIRDYKYEDWINDTDAQIQKEQDENPGVINPTTENRPGILNPKEATYKLGSKNPFAAPAILAGMNAVAGALENRDAKAQQRELMNRLSFDQMSTELRGSDGDYAFNTGMFRPDQMVPVQFTGYNNPTSQFGGAFEKDQEYYLDDNTIQAILNAGGEIEYLD